MPLPLTHLILVAGHAIYTSNDFTDPTCDGCWSLQSFQTAEPAFYLEHIQHGIARTQADPSALLVFSGGQTRLEAGPRSEAQSYWMLARHLGWLTQDVEDRVTTEEFARDSFENLLFGICRFYEWTQTFPQTITAVSWGFKQERFQHHRDALQFPKDHFHFVGVNQPPQLEAALRGEARTIEAFRLDPYGNHPPLSQKRQQRDPFRRTPPYALSCPPLRALLQHRKREPFASPLPWHTENP
ncbi:MAG: hypothetical protein H6728_16305 [Myxococcales bacterium]|nr:hypothetical protein [Myxococcales bacterium]